MIDFDTKEEWQVWFSETFPDGISVFKDLSDLHFFSTHVTVAEMEGDRPVIRFYPSHIPMKVMDLRLESVSEISDKRYSLTTEDTNDPNWTFVSDIDPDIAEGLRSEKEKQEALRAKYAD